MRSADSTIRAVCLAVASLLTTGCVAPRPTVMQTNGQVAVPGLEAEARIERDGFGVPHLVARSERDLYFLQGFAQAQDRLWIMEMFRRSASGRLSEIFGKQAMTGAEELPFVRTTIDFDHFHRLIGFRRLAETTADRLRRARPESYRLLEAYSAGVNAWLAHARAGREMPWEFRFLRFRPEPWTPADTLAIYRMIAWHFSHNWSREWIRFRLLCEHGDDPAVLEVSPEQLPRPGNAPAEGRSPGMRFPLGFASNAFVLSGERTKSGKPILAGDPHAAVLFPSIFLDAWLTCDAFDAAGVSLAGVPGLLLGHNQHLAWTLTDSFVDTQDLTIEKASADTTSSETIRIRSALLPTLPFRKTVTRPAQQTADGRPLLDRFVPGGWVPAGHGLSVRWPGFDFFDETATLNALLKARNAGEFRAVLAGHHAPVMNFVHADREGVIGYCLAGRLPKRAPTPWPAGTLPVPGWKREFDWQGWLPFAENPQTHAPGRPFLVSANNRLAPFGSLPHEVGFDYVENYRAARLTELLEAAGAAGQRCDLEVVLRWQNDIVSMMGRAFAPLYAAATDDPLARALLEHWAVTGCEATTDSAGAALFYEAHRAAFERTYRHEMSSELFGLFAADKTVLGKFDLALRAAPTGERDEMLRNAVRDAMSDLTRFFGTTDVHQWHWGRRNVLQYVHPFGERGPLRRALAFGEAERPGGRDTVNWSYGPWFPVDGRRDHRVRLATVCKWAVDMAAPEKAQITHHAGQSGRPFTEHFLDQAPLWRELSPCQYRPMTATGPPHSVLVLRPVPATTP
jgi:penicillin amidase